MTNESVLYFAYQKQRQAADEAEAKAAEYKRTLESNCAYRKGTKVEYEGKEYYVFDCNLWHNKYESSKDIPEYWLTLTKLRANGKFPSRPIAATYSGSEYVKVIGYYGDESK